MSDALRSPSSNNAWGSCCPELQEALRQGPDSAARVTDSILYLAVGRHTTLAAGPAGWAEEQASQATLCCPFCGKKFEG